MRTIEDRNVYIVEATRKFLTQFMDLKSIPLPRIFVTDTTSSSRQFFVPSVLRFYKKDPSLFDQYANLCVLKQLDWINRIRLMVRTLNNARNLILSLKKRYHFE